MNINVKGGLKATMMGVFLIAAFVMSACGVIATSQPQYEQAGRPFKGTAESMWAENAGEEIKPTGFSVDVDLVGPLHGPSPKASNFDAIGRVGTKCIAEFVEGMPGSNESLITILYIEKGDYMVPVAAHDGSEGNVAGANRLIAYFKSQCGT